MSIQISNRLARTYNGSFDWSILTHIGQGHIHKHPARMSAWFCYRNVEERSIFPITKQTYGKFSMLRIRAAHFLRWARTYNTRILFEFALRNKPNLHIITSFAYKGSNLKMRFIPSGENSGILPMCLSCR